VTVISDLVGEVGDLRLEGGVFRVEPFALAGVVVGGVMLREAFADFPGKVKAGEGGVFLLDLFHDAQAVHVVFEAAAAAHEPGQFGFPLVTEGGMAEVMGEGDGLGQVGVQLQRAGDIPRDGGHFHGMGEPGAEMVAAAVQENLGLVFKPAEGAGMDDAVAVPLILGAPDRGFLTVFAAPGIRAELGVGRQNLALDLFQFLAGAGHDSGV